MTPVKEAKQDNMLDVLKTVSPAPSQIMFHYVTVPSTAKTIYDGYNDDDNDDKTTYNSRVLGEQDSGCVTGSINNNWYTGCNRKSYGRSDHLYVKNQ